MEEEIEERLQEELKDLTIKVKYFKIKMYNIYLFDIKQNRYYIYLYKWNDILTFTSNIEQIKYIIRKIMKGSVKNG